MSMRAIMRRRCTYLAVMALLVLLVGGCAGKATKSAPEQATTPQSSTTTVAPTTTGPAPMTAVELAWLKALPKLDAKIEKAIQASSEITPTVLRSLASAFHSCTLELQRLGVPSERLRPVYVLLKRACGEYEKGAKCFAAAADIGIPVSGTPESQAFDKALDCGFKSQPKGAVIMVKALNNGEDIKRKAETS